MKQMIKKFIITITVLCLGMVSAIVPTFAATASNSDTQAGSKTIEVSKAAAGKQLTFKPKSDSNYNYKTLQSLISGNAQKTITIENGSNFVVNGSLRPGNNTTIIAKGATITFTKTKAGIFTVPKATNYKSIENLTVIGGKWRSQDASGRQGTMFSISHGTGIVLDGVDAVTNSKGHAVEIIACKNVAIKNCKLYTIGACKQSCMESVIQIDIATKASAPKLAAYGSKYVKGQTCRNVKILNNKVTGPNAVRVTWTKTEKGKYISKYHKNLTVTGNTLTSKTSEGLAIFNITGKVVLNKNTIISNGKATSDSHTVGLHIDMYGKAPTSVSKSVINITNNTVKGGRNGIFVFGHSNKKYGKVTVQSNKVYCKKGKSAAIVKREIKKAAKKVSVSKNKLYKW